MMRIAVLASGEETILQALIDGRRSGTLSVEIAFVISNNAESGALRRADASGISTSHLSAVTHPDADELDGSMLAKLIERQVDLIVLAGCLKKIGPQVLTHFKGRIINTHPSLLPRQGGRGMYGRHVHAAVLASGETETGVSVHLVDVEYDTGRVIAQARISVEQVDTVTGRIGARIDY